MFHVSAPDSALMNHRTRASLWAFTLVRSRDAAMNSANDELFACSSSKSNAADNSNIRRSREMELKSMFNSKGSKFGMGCMLSIKASAKL